MDSSKVLELCIAKLTEASALGHSREALLKRSRLIDKVERLLAQEYLAIMYSIHPHVEKKEDEWRA